MSDYTAAMPAEPSPAEPSRAASGTSEYVSVPTVLGGERSDRKTELLSGGSGPPLLYLHSAAGEMEWSGLHERLAERFTVYAPAHPGFSYSAGGESIRSVADLAWHTLDLIDLLADRDGWSAPIPVVGFSLGGWIAAEAAILRPSHISQLVLTCAAGLRLEHAPYGDLFQDDLVRLRELLFHDPSDLDTVERSMPISMQDGRLVQWLKAREATARVAWNPYLHNPRLPDHLHRITAKTLVLWADGDRLIPPAHADAWAAAIPGARKQLIADAGHMLPLENPNRWADAVLAFLDGP